MVEPDAPVVGGHQNQPVFCSIIGPVCKGGQDLCNKTVCGFYGVDVLGDIGIEAISMPVDVHVVKVEKDGVGVGTFQD